MTEIGRVTWIDSTEIDGELLSRVRVRMESGDSENFYIRGIEPWGYVHEDAELPERDWIVDVEYGYESLFNDPLKRVVTTVPEKVNNRRDDDTLVNHVSESWEADIPYYRKQSIIDSISGYIQIPQEASDQIKGFNVYKYSNINTEVEYEGEIEPRIMFSDIEVKVSGGKSFEEVREQASEPINVITSYDNYENEYTVFFYNKYDNLQSPEEIREVVEEELESAEDMDISLYSLDTEKEMLNVFIDYVEDREFDLTSGWNWTDFDYEYIIGRIGNIENLTPSFLSPFNRCGWANNDRMQIRGLPAFDMLTAFDKMTFTNFRSMSLDYVSRQELGVGKVDDVDINEAWKSNAEKLIAYNIVDVALTVLLDESNDIHNFFYEIGDICSIPIYDTFYEKRQVDGYVMSRRYADEILPSVEESEVPNAGGYVADSISGRRKSVGVSDLKSLYPSAIITWNISTETISDKPEFDDYVKVPHVPEPKNVSGKIEGKDIDWSWLYCDMSQEGLIPRVLKKLFDKREYEKKKMYSAETTEIEEKWDRKQGSTKVIMNSFYGNASSPYWRLANEYLGDAITSAARYTLWKGEQTIDELGYEHLYSDTDSHFISLHSDTLEEQVEELKEVSAKMDEDASKIASDIGIEGKHPFLVDEDLHGDDYTCMVWEPEKIYEVWMQLGRKKRYCGNMVWKEGKFYEKNISITGFENQRSDSPPITAELQEKIIDMVLTGAEFDEVSEYIQSIINEIDEHQQVRRFALPGSLNRDLEDYTNTQITRGARYSNDNLGYGFSEGDDPFVYLVKRTPANLPDTDVLALEWNEEIPEGFELDKESIIERAVKKPIESILNEVDWKFEEVRSGREQKTQDLTNEGSNPFL